MISFNTLGCNGYLGNQMFQYATLKGIANHKGYEYSIPKFDILTQRPFGYDIIKCFNISKTKENKNYSWINEKKFEFDQQFFDHCPDNVDICGYFQTEKYFKHIESQIREEYTFVDEISQICLDYKKNKFFNSQVISIHVRRGDYITDQNFDCLDLDYYYSAIELLPNFPILITTNDFKWCQEKFTDERFTISLFNDPCIDLCLMSLCNYHIIANSSFSWWGSWLAKSKKTIAPKNWFSSTGSLSNYDTRDLYLVDWIII